MLLYSNDFESSIGSEWNSTTTDNSYPSTFSRFLGNFSNNSATLTLATVPGSTYFLEFDFYAIDSWDGNYTPYYGPDYFNVSVDGTQIFHETFSNISSYPQSYRPPDQGGANTNLGFISSWGDSIYRKIPISFTATNSTTQIRFADGGLQGLGDESWGIDNVSVDLKAPDLAVSSDMAPLNAILGGTTEVSWEVSNQGSGSALADWYDAIYVSDDTTFDESDTYVASYLTGDKTPLVNGSSYTITQNITIPNTKTGSRYLLFVADIDKNQPETDETNNSFAVPIELKGPDLAVESVVTIPANAQFGQAIDVTWNVRNVGSEPTESSWSDRIWLSSDTTLSEDDILLLTQPASNISLVANSQYSQTASVTLPLDATVTEGTYYILIKTDADSEQVESNKSNNTASASLPIIVPPTPDLVVSLLAAPATEFSGQRVQVSWMIANQGTAAAGTWADQIFFSTNTIAGDADDVPFGTFSFTGTIAAGESLTRTQEITLPIDWSGARSLVIKTDVNNQVYEHTSEGNNVTVSEQPIAITLSPFPNLQVSSITSPTTAFSSAQTEVSWTVTNNGIGATNTSFWYDQVWLSQDDILDLQGDYYLGRTLNPSYLNPGESYSRSLIASLPRSIDGSWRFIIKADGNNQVFEYDAENDNVAASDPVALKLTPPPDLQVTRVTIAPTSPFSGQQVTFNWTVTNTGLGRTLPEETTWTDELLMTKNPDGTGEVYSLGRFFRNSGLQPNEFYSRSQTVNLPIGKWQDYFFVVKADVNNQVYENAFEDNNTGFFDANTNDSIDTPTNILLTPPPDLTVKSVTTPVDARAGQPLTISYRISNQGATDVPTRTPNWSDAFYLSTSSTLDPNTTIFLGNQIRNGVLDAGDFYNSTATFTLPNGISGEYYVFVVADNNNAIFEQDDVDAGTAISNIGSTATPVNVASRPADLVITNFTAPAVVDAGKNARISWSVLNQGIGDTIITSWVDQLVASANNIVGDDDDLELGVFSRSAEPLLPEVTYSRTEDVAIPFHLVGNYNLFLVTDSREQVYEGANENNNSSVAVPVTVNRLTPDLQVTTVSATTAAVSGDSIAVSWTVENIGVGITNADFWYDEVFLSSDQTIDSSDRLIGTIRRNGTLAAGSEYTVNTNLTLPTNLSGNYSILVRTDSESRYGLNDRVLEISESNNTNAATPPLTITLNPVPDLNVTGVDALVSALSGQSLSLIWSVSNTGLADTGNRSWFDAVYLSRDQVFDRSNGDIYLGAILHNGGLASGQSYTQTQSFSVLRGLSGPFYTFVLTDSQAVIDERSSESNNIGYDSGATQIILPLPSDLVPLASSITLPSTGTAGRSLMINYTVQNQGSDVALGSWSDALYLSTDNQWDLNDVLIAQVAHSGDVAGGSSYTGSLSALLPGVIPGNYQVLVRSDIRDQVPETNENNNNAASVGTISVDFESLAVGGSVTGTLAKEQAVYYKIQASAGQALKLQLDSQDNNGANELYVRYGEVPTRGQFDRTAESPFLADPNLILPIAQDGTYYVMVYGNSVTGAPSYTLTATDVPFSITDVEKDVVGNVGQATVKVEGARFEEGTIFELIDSQANIIAQVKDLFKDSTTDFVTFDLQGKTAGTYSLRAIQPNGVTTILGDAVTVQDGVGANISEAINGPPRVWAGQKYPISINYGNSGDTDATAPLLIVRNRNSATGLTPRYDNTEEKDRVVQLYGSGSDIGLGQLRPGESHSIPLYFTHLGAPGSNDARVTVEEVNLADIEKISAEDWDTLKQSAKPDGIDEVRWDAFWSSIQPGIGETWGDYVQLISQLSQAYNSAGERLDDVRELFERWYSDTDATLFQFRPKPSISGQLIDRQTNLPASGVTLDFYQAVDDLTFKSFRQIVTDEQGRFNISSLSPSTYQLVAPNGYSFIDPNATGIQPTNTIYTVTISPESGGSNIQLSINSLSDPIFYADDEYNNLLQQLDIIDAEVENVLNSLNSAPNNLSISQAQNLRVLSASSSLSETPIRAANSSSGPLVPSPGGGIIIPIPGLGKLELKETREEKLSCSSGEITDNFTGVLKLNVLPDSDNPSTALVETSNQAKLSIKSKYKVNSDTCQYEYDKTNFSVETAQFIKSNNALDGAIILAEAFFPEALPLLRGIKGGLEQLKNATGFGITGSIAGSVGIQGNLEVDKNDKVTGSVNLNLGFGGGFSITAGELFKADVSLVITGTVSSTGKVSGKAKASAVVKVGAFEGILEASTDLLALRVGETPEGMTLPGVGGLVETFLSRRPSTPNLPPECNCDPPNDYNPPALRSSDPNDIIGPDGFGPERWISDKSPLDYTIRFENVATATAPAKQVVITQQLDADLDSRSFRLGSFGWGGLVFQVPENRSFYSERLDLREQYGIYVDVSAFVDIRIGEVRWEIKAIDPETGDIPSDPLKGFLPPNLIGGEGEGYVSYTVKTKNTSETGDKIDAQARIVFDNNEPIDTPAIFNTIDTQTPISSVTALPSTSNNPVFLISWAGSDDPQGSGLAGYNVYVSKDDAPFEVWIERTTLTEATYTGEAGHTYRFYSLAVDNVGNEQDATTATPTTISVVGSGILEFSNLSFSVAEDGTAISQVTVIRTNGSSGAIGATLNLSDGSATGDSQPLTTNSTADSRRDYDSTPVLVEFGDGEMLKTVIIPIVDDALIEPNETINLILSSPTGGATIGTQSTATLTVVDDDVELAFSNTEFSVNEDGTPIAAVTVTRTGRSSGTVSATVTLSDGTATGSADYDNAPVVVEFADGDSTPKTIFIPIIDDVLLEGDETLNLALGNPTGGAALGAQNTAVLTIANNDVELAFDAAEFSVNEDGTPIAAVTVSRTGRSTGAVSAEVSLTNGTADSPSDYDSTPVLVEFGDGETTKNVVIPIVDDTLIEASETISLILGSPTGGATISTQSTATLTVADNDVELALSSAEFSVNEDGTPITSVTVNRTGRNSGEVSATITLADDSATSGADYDNTPINVRFADGETTKTIVIPIVDDTLVENNETINLALSNPTGGATVGAQNTATLTVVDNDVQLAFSAAEFRVNEDGIPIAAVTVTRTGRSSGEVSAMVTPSARTATSGVDYDNTAIQVSFADGEMTKTVVIPIVDDTLAEAPETIQLALGSPTGGATIGTQSTATLTIADNDVELAFSSAEFSVNENGTPVSTVTVTRTGRSSGEVSATVTPTDGSATSAADYDNTPINVRFADGETTKTVTIPINNDTLIESNETINLALSNPTGGVTIGAQNTATLTVVEDDVQLAFSSSNFSVTEDGTPLAAVTVTRTGRSSGVVSATLTPTDGIANRSSDYNNTPIQVNFADGEIAKTVVVPLVNDAIVEADETLNLTLSNPTGGATIGTQNSAVLTIANNDFIGGGRNDILTGSDGNDTIFDKMGNDILLGVKGNDRLDGGDGNDTLIGGMGNDYLLGGRGNDILTGVDPSALNPGRGEVDTLTSGKGKNQFILGDAAKVYYNDGNDTNSGINDYALLLDFNHNKDVIQLHGSASNYVLGASPVGLPAGTAIFQKTPSQDELIGVVQGDTGLSLNSSYFSFVR